MASIGENIRRIRKEKHLTLKQLADKTLCTPQAIGQYERGERKPSYTKLVYIASALGVSVLDITGESFESMQTLSDYVDDLITKKTAEREAREHDPVASATYDVLDNPKNVPEWITKDLSDNQSIIKNAVDYTVGHGVGKVVLRFLSAWSKLNRPGRMKLIEFIEDFASIPKYLEVEENDQEES